MIIRSVPGKLQEVVEEIRPFVEEMQEILPRLRGPDIIPFTAYPMKVIPNFNMVASYLPREVIFALADDPCVDLIFPDQIMFALQYFPTVSSDAVYRAPHRVLKEITFTSTFWTKRLLGVDIANDKGFSGRDVLVGILDTGASRVHQQIRRVEFRTTMGQYRDESGHGTWCVSCIGGIRARDDYLSKRSGKAVLCEGMAPRCDLLAIKCLGYFVGMGSTSNIIASIDLALRREVDVMSLSLGGDSMTESPHDDPYYSVMEEVVRQTIPVVAAGNSGPRNNTVGTPGAMPQVLTVGSYNPIKGSISPFSSRGPTNWDDIKPDVMAPGEDIDSAIVGVLDTSGDGVPNRFSPISGTSMAAPHVAGLIALMVETHRRVLGKRLAVEEIKDMMARLGTDKNNTMGWGHITWQIYERWLSTTYGVEI